MSPAHEQFSKVCDELGLTRNSARQVIMALTGGIQGGELNRKTGTLKVAPDKLRSFVTISMGLLAQDVWKEFPVRH